MGKEGFSVDKGEILELYPIETFLETHLEGFRHRSKGQATAFCPFHEETQGSFSIRVADGLWNCKGCGEKGDFFKLWGFFNKMDPKTEFKGILETMRSELGLSPSEFRKHGAPPPKKRERKATPPSPPMDERIAGGLVKNMTPERYEELSDLRLVSIDVLKEMEIGWDRWRERYSLPIRDGKGKLRNIRLYGPGKDLKMLNWWHWHCPSCDTPRPVADVRGSGKDRTYFCPSCKTQFDEGKDKKTYGDARLYPLPKFLDTDPKEVVFCEGEWDCLTLWSRGVPALTSTHGANTWSKDWAKLFVKKKINLIMDADKPGKAAALKHAESLIRSRKSDGVKIINLPLNGTKSDKDLTDWFKSGRTIEALVKVIKKTPEYFLTPDEPEEPKNKQDHAKEDDSYEDIDYSPHFLGDMFLSKGSYSSVGGKPRLRFWREDWYRWSKHSYEKIVEIDLKIKLAAFLRGMIGKGMLTNKAAKSVVSDMLLTMADPIQIPTKMEAPAYYDIANRKGREINDIASFENGILSLKRAIKGDYRLEAHRPEYFILNSYNFDYDQEATCPVWEEYLDFCFPDKEIRDTLQEWTGYLLTKDNSLQYFMVFLGEGGTGKSTYLETITDLLGRSTVSHLALDQIGRQYGISGLLGKTANICGDLGDVDQNGEGVLKMLAGEDSVSIERKYKDNIDVLLNCRLIFASNKIPRFKDKTDGLWRKMVLIPADQKVPPGMKDKDLKGKLRGEKPGILNWSLIGLARLKERGYFIEPAAARELKATVRDELNPARTFLKDFTEFAPGKTVESAVLFKAYKEFCERDGYRNYSEVNFHKELQRLYREKDVKKTRPVGYGGRRVYMYENLDYVEYGSDNKSEGKTDDQATMNFDPNPENDHDDF